MKFVPLKELEERVKFEVSVSVRTAVKLQNIATDIDLSVSQVIAQFLDWAVENRQIKSTSSRRVRKSDPTPILKSSPSEV